MACGGSNPTAETPKPHEETAEEKRSREYKALRDAEPKRYRDNHRSTSLGLILPI